MRKGTHLSEESKKKVSESRKGIPAWNKGKRKITIVIKVCESCGIEYSRHPDSSDELWLKRRFCSKSCALRGNKRTLGKNLGKDNPGWKGGITSKNAILRSSYEMNCWRRAVFERDNYTCRGCGIRGNKLHAHHVLSFSKFPNHRFDVDNGLTLCKSCHKKTDNYAGKCK